MQSQALAPSPDPFPSLTPSPLWDASTDNLGVIGYEVSRDGSVQEVVSGTGYTDTGLMPESSYGYQVVALDAAGNRSPAKSVTATTAEEDTTPPSAPTGLQVDAVTATSVDLSWMAATDNQGVSGYLVYRDGQEIGASAGTTYMDSGLDPETSYEYSVKAVDLAGNQSAPSAGLVATTGAAPTCTVSGAPSLRLGDNKVEWKLTNLSDEAVTIARIQATWPSEQGSIKKIKRDKEEIFAEQVQPPSATIDTWKGSTADRQIKAGDTDTLKLEFTAKYKGDGEADYTIFVGFEEGCSVRF